MASSNPLFLIREFAHCVSLLWRDKLGQVSLATTTLFWGAGATLQFIVIDWAAKALGSTCRRRRCCRAWSPSASRSARCIAARYVSLRGAVNVLPIGVAMGLDRDLDDLRHARCRWRWC